MTYTIWYCWYRERGKNEELINKLKEFCDKRGWEFKNFPFTWYPIDLSYPASRGSDLRGEQDLIKMVLRSPSDGYPLFEEKEGKVYYPREFILILKDKITPIAVYPSVYVLNNGEKKVLDIKDFFKFVKEYGLKTPQQDIDIFR